MAERRVGWKWEKSDRKMEWGRQMEPVGYLKVITKESAFEKENMRQALVFLMRNCRRSNGNV